jgi:hypothetical protein
MDDRSSVPHSSEKILRFGDITQYRFSNDSLGIRHPVAASHFSWERGRPRPQMTVPIIDAGRYPRG